MASIQGWGRQTWNSGAWNQQAPVSVTGNGLTSSLGTETVATDQNISVTGIGLTSTAGTAVGTGIAEVTPTGIALTSSTGEESTSTDQNISVSGLGTTLSLGNESTSVTKLQVGTVILILIQVILLVGRSTMGHSRYNKRR